MGVHSQKAPTAFVERYLRNLYEEKNLSKILKEIKEDTERILSENAKN